MKASLLISAFSFLTMISNAQVKYLGDVRKFIDYDTAVVVLKNALLIDGSGRGSKLNQAVVIKTGKIDWIGDVGDLSIPAGAQVIDLTGKTLMPGLVLLHEHMYIRVPGGEHLIIKQMPTSFPRLYLACGATTIRTAGSNEPYIDLGIKKSIESGTLAGPSIHLTAPYIEGKAAPINLLHKLSVPEQAIQHVNYWGDQGFTSFKVYRSIEKNVLKAAIETAHKRQLKVTGHLCSITHREAAELGIDHLEHGFMDCTDFIPAKKENECPTVLAKNNSIANINLQGDSVQSLIQLLVRKKISLTSTLAVFEGFVSSQPLPPSDLLEMLSTDHRDNYLKFLIRVRGSVSAAQIAFDKTYIQAAKMEKIFNDAGGLVTVGTDPTGNGGVIAGFSSWRAVELLVEVGGFSPLEALKIATINGAIALGIEKQTGTIEVGKEADLIIIDGDPSKTISDIRKVVWVFKDGVGFNSKRMIESVKGKVGYY